MFEKIVNVTGAFDKRTDDPKTNYGIGACRIWFILKGEKGAVQFHIGTDWNLPEVQRELRDSRYNSAVRFDNIQPQGWDLGYHSWHEQYDGQAEMECELSPNGKCYYDGSSLNADEMVPDFIAGGTEWLWPRLEEFYREIFESED